MIDPILFHRAQNTALRLMDAVAMVQFHLRELATAPASQLVQEDIAVRFDEAVRLSHQINQMIAKGGADLSVPLFKRFPGLEVEISHLIHDQDQLNTLAKEGYNAFERQAFMRASLRHRYDYGHNKVVALMEDRGFMAWVNGHEEKQNASDGMSGSSMPGDAQY